MKDISEIELRGRLSGQQKTRMQNLFDMMYRPSELAEEIGITKRQFYRVYIPLGLPVERDSRNHVWINGLVFNDWILEYYKKVKLNENEAFCLTCKRAVEIIEPIHNEINKMVYITCDCLHCGRKLSKIINKKFQQ